MITIAITIAAGEKQCGECEFMKRHSTGLKDEWHMYCSVFSPYYGAWGEPDMKRSQRCIRAERKFAASSRQEKP